MYFIKNTVSDDPLTWRYALSLIKDSVRAYDRLHFILKAYAPTLYLAHESIILLKGQATVLLLHHFIFILKSMQHFTSVSTQLKEMQCYLTLIIAYELLKPISYEHDQNFAENLLHTHLHFLN